MYLMDGRVDCRRETSYLVGGGLEKNLSNLILIDLTKRENGIGNKTCDTQWQSAAPSQSRGGSMFNWDLRMALYVLQALFWRKRKSMEVFGCSKHLQFVSLSLFSFLLQCTLFALAQPGFLTLDCGTQEGNHTSTVDNITWVPDDNFIHNLGEKAVDEYNNISLRVFPKPLNKSCYELPITPKVPHLLRLQFIQPNSTGSRGFNYSVETLDMLYMENVAFDYNYEVRSENILVSEDSLVHICLIRTSEYDDPFINGIELRPLKQGMYDGAKPGIMLHKEERCDMGADNRTRYPDDPFDRLWDTCDSFVSGTKTVDISKSISADNTTNFPPSKVMQTAVVGNTSDMYFYLRHSTSGKALALLYFAQLNSIRKRSFSIGINNVIQTKQIDLVANLSAIELRFEYNGTTDAILNLQSKIRGYGPIINAYEIYALFKTQLPTFSDDVKALTELKKALSLKKWISDPCFGFPWEGIICKNVSNTKRISQIDLSGRQLGGSIPPGFEQLTELIFISLNNNSFNGTLPNLTSVYVIEILHLQNNHLSGKIPDWLSKLPYLKELDISNNNFKGVIPEQLLNKKNFTFNYCNFNGNTQKERHARVTSIAVGVAGTIIGAAIVVGMIIIYRMKSKSPCTPPSPLDDLMVNVANSSKTRAFTLEEMTTATRNFTDKIGQGSFGTVFVGKLQEGKQIAVKLLSVLNKHGIDQFSNEIDLLSKINHKKLVSFLGYCICNESRDLMLVYEYMSAGSLSDNLHDPDAPKYPQLGWKTRLKIALDAAQGLEYLHVGCTPKIIHRDVKTSNILLDSNLNGKLADFGLSRVTGNGETSHIYTAIKGTPGYLDPMYYRTQMLTDKSDVYSFGVVLFELISGRKPIDLKVSDGNILLTEWVASYVGEDKDDANIAEIVDKRLGGRYNMKSIVDVANVAWRCIASEPSGRPSISEVEAQIREAVELEEEYEEAVAFGVRLAM